MDAEALVRDYLGRLEAEARRLTPREATDLVADVGEHIEAALAAAGSRDAATVREILDRLGPPEAIVAAAAADEEGSAAGPASVRGGDAPAPSRGRRLTSWAPWLLGALAGTAGVVGGFPLIATHGLAAPFLPFAALAALLVVLIARRPGGLAFLAATLGVAGALMIALAMSVPLSCPSGEFSSECSGPRLAAMIVPSLGLVVLGALLTRHVARQS